MMNAAIGVDIGATVTKLVWLRASGEVIDETRVASSAADADVLVATIGTVIEPWLAAAEPPTPQGVGVAAPGLVGVAEGRVLHAPNLAILDNFPLGDALARVVGCRVSVHNDAHAAGLAEARWGAAVGAEMAVCLTVGTGVGGAIIEGGRLWYGCGGFAGEIGRTVLGLQGDVFFEEEVGAAAVVRAYQDRGGAADAGVDAAAISRRAAAGDGAAVAALDVCGRRLGAGIALLVNLLNPSVIVVGGGVASAGELFLGPARAAAEQRTWPPAWCQCDVVAARLGTNAGAMGAALFAMEAEALQ